MNLILMRKDAVGQVLINICEEICDPVMKGVMLVQFIALNIVRFLGTDDFHSVIHQVILAGDQFSQHLLVFRRHPDISLDFAHVCLATVQSHSTYLLKTRPKSQ